MGQVYNVALGDETTLNALHGMIAESLALRDPAFAATDPVYRDFRPGDVRHSRADISRIRRLLGFRPTHRVREGLEQTLDWYISRIGPVTKRGERLALSAGGGPAAISNSPDRMGHPFAALD